MRPRAATRSARSGHSRIPVFADSIEKVPENMVEIKPTIMVSVPRLFEKIYSRIFENVHQMSALKRSLFHWALATGKKYVQARYIEQRSDPFLAFKYKLADRIVDRFGQETLEIIENQPERLREVSDIGPKRIGLIAREAIPRTRQPGGAQHIDLAQVILGAGTVDYVVVDRRYSRFRTNEAQLLERIATDSNGGGCSSGIRVDHEQQTAKIVVYRITRGCSSLPTS